MLRMFRPLLAVFMAMVVLVSTTSLTISKHYCGDRLIETSIVTDNAGCTLKTSTSKKNSCRSQKSQCCSDESYVIEGIDLLQFEKYVTTFESDFHFDVNRLCYLDIDSQELSKSNYLSFFRYKQPPLIKEIYRLDESYLI